MRLPAFPTLLASLLLALLVLPACGSETETVPPEDTTVDTPPVLENDILAAAREAGLTTLVTAIETAGLVETLQGEGPFTVFAPTNEAFAALPAGTLDTLLAPAHHDELRRILTYHVVPGRIESTTLAGAMTFDSVEGATLNVEAGDDGVKVVDANGNSVSVVTPDVNVSNGVVHVIDGVLMPGAAEDGLATN